MKRKSCWKAWSASGDRTNVIRVWIAKIPNFQWNHSPPPTLFSFGREKTLRCFRCIWISLSRGQNVSQGAMQRQQELATPDRPLCKPKHRNSWTHRVLWSLLGGLTPQEISWNDYWMICNDIKHCIFQIPRIVLPLVESCSIMVGVALAKWVCEFGKYAPRKIQQSNKLEMHFNFW